jgi:hypothetical protein
MMAENTNNNQVRVSSRIFRRTRDNQLSPGWCEAEEEKCVVPLSCLSGSLELEFVENVESIASALPLIGFFVLRPSTSSEYS